MPPKVTNDVRLLEALEEAAAKGESEQEKRQEVHVQYYVAAKIMSLAVLLYSSNVLLAHFILNKIEEA